jgi:hypothetical protein
MPRERLSLPWPLDSDRNGKRFYEKSCGVVKSGAPPDFHVGLRLTRTGPPIQVPETRLAFHQH